MREHTGTVNQYIRKQTKVSKWMMTNADTEQKKGILTQALKVLGYSSDEIQSVIKAIL